MIVIGIDPGQEKSGLVAFDFEGTELLYMSILDNELVLDRIHALEITYPLDDMSLAIEKPACMGMAVGASVFDTCIWIGRFDPNCEALLITRNEIKMHLCGNMRAKDKNIRQALIDRFGPVGVKATPGVLYGVKSHLWAALAVAVMAWDIIHQEEVPK
jgi:hypothetical protein